MSSIEKAIQKFKKKDVCKSTGRQDVVKTRTEITTQLTEPVLSDTIESSIEAVRHDLHEKVIAKPIRNNKIHNLDFQYLSENGFITPDSTNQTLIEEYRIIKRPILNNAFNKSAQKIINGNVITVVSSLPNEGKTFNALNVALSISMERDTTVLLVDADVTKPSLSRLLGLEDELGLLDILSNEKLDFVDVVCKTNIENLSILPAGKYQKEAAELIYSDRKNRFLDEISTRYPNRIIIFDAPPLLVASHSGILVDMAGQILFVVEEGKTRENIIREAVSLIDENKVVGMLLNKTHRVLSGEYYGTYGAVPRNDS